MFHLIGKKIINNKWLTICLILGMTFLVAVVSCQPMFRKGSQDKLLSNLMSDYIKENNLYPTVLSRKQDCQSDAYPDLESINKEIQGYQETWLKYLGDVDCIATQSRIRIEEQIGKGKFAEHANDMQISYMPELEKHIQIVKGDELKSFKGDGYPCLISPFVMDQFGLSVGEEIEFEYFVDQNNKPLKLVVTGIAQEKDPNDIFFVNRLNTIKSELFVSKESFETIVKEYKPDSIYYEHNVILDYKQFNNVNAGKITYYLNKFENLDECFSYSCKDILASYDKQKNTIGVIIWVLEIPILGMVFAFILMVSKQIIEMEKNEIAMLKSRGVSKGQIILLYALQFGILALFSLIIGVGLGYCLCKLVGGTTNFLTFSMSGGENYHFTPWMILYGLVGAIIGILIVLIPVFINSNASIVEQKAGKHEGQKPFWEKYYLDIGLFVISIYLVYTFYQSLDSIKAKALSGVKMDPIIFLDSSLFIVAFGLVTLRLVQYLIRFVYYLGRNKWKPASYASFLQITRNFNKQGAISVFMILTISLGLFNANTARTINQNNVDRIEYEDGADLVVQKRWIMKMYPVSPTVSEFRYEEPSTKEFESCVGNGCEEMTKVIINDKTIAEKIKGNQSISDCYFMGINTKEFGEIATLKNDLNKDVHWYTYLNSLAEDTRGVIISRNLAESLELKVGDTFSVKRMYPIKSQEMNVLGLMTAKVVAIVDAWPGFDQYYYEEGKLKERNLIVANYAQSVEAFEISPYEVWMKLSKDVTGGEIVNSLKEEGMDVEYYKSVDKAVDEMKRSPLIQITNGMFTLSFIIALILCTIGFLIYWLTSIKQRELLFGVYRAMGMSMKEINKMLLNEHIFSTFLSVLAGGLVGMVSTLVFVKIFGVVYLPEKHNLGIYIYFEPMDAWKLAFVIAAMIVICLMAIRKLIQKMNISQALKLGEE